MNTNSSSNSSAIDSAIDTVVSYCLCCGGLCAQDGLCEMERVSLPRWKVSECAWSWSWSVIASSQEEALERLKKNWYVTGELEIERDYSGIPEEDYSEGIYLLHYPE